MSRPDDAASDDTTPEVEPDVTSDPALADENGSEWSDEGGATDEGSASASDAS